MSNTEKDQMMEYLARYSTLPDSINAKLNTLIRTPFRVVNRRYDKDFVIEGDPFQLMRYIGMLGIEVETYGVNHILVNKELLINKLCPSQ